MEYALPVPSDYHHGDLPSALRAAAVELIAERGPGGFSLREVARRAGVSHSAPAHHFGDTKGLLTSVAEEGFNHLTEQMALASDGATNARDRLIACGQAYVATALANPGHYGVMIGHEYTDENDEACMVASIGSYQRLLTAIEALRDEYNPELDVDTTATVCWSTMHGLVELSPILSHVAALNETETSPINDLVVHYVDVVIGGVSAR